MPVALREPSSPVLALGRRASRRVERAGPRVVIEARPGGGGASWPWGLWLALGAGRDRKGARLLGRLSLRARSKAKGVPGAPSWAPRGDGNFAANDRLLALPARSYARFQRTAQGRRRTDAERTAIVSKGRRAPVGRMTVTGVEAAYKGCGGRRGKPPEAGSGVFLESISSGHT
jgi:hypothetical protein